MGEDWLVAVTTDHGHKPEGGQGEDEVEVRRSFLLLHRIGGDLPGWTSEPRALRAHEVMGVLRDLPPAGPTRNVRFEW